MAATKIINVLKDDTFDEILELFKSTSADEVIFVLPKTARAFKKEEHFAELKTEADGLEKDVSFLCSNPDINNLAKKYKFDVLLSRTPVAKKSKHTSPPINIVNQIDDFYDARPEPAQEAEEPVYRDVPEEPRIVATTRRRMDDIVTPQEEEERSVRVATRREKDFDVDVHQDFKVENLQHRALNEIRGIWAEEPKKDIKGWSNIFSISKKDKIHKTEYRPTSKKGYKKVLGGLGATAIVLLGVIVFVTTGSAKITVTPQSQALEFQLNVSTSNSVAAVDLANSRVPGQLFNIQKSVSQEFPSTGLQDVAQKARGTITIYNEMATAQPLIATTRFTSTQGLIFRTLSAVVVPAAKTVSGKLTPGKIDVNVIADKADASYNVPGGKFTIPAFQEKGDSDKYAKIYGQSTQAMHGGTSGQAKVVTQQDFMSAKDTLSAKLQTQIKDQLTTDTNGLKIVNDSQVQIADPVSSAQADEAADKFTMQLSGLLKTVGFKESDLFELVKKYIDSQYGLVAVQDKLTMSYSNIQFDPMTNTLIFSVSVKGPGYAKVDQAKIINELGGKKAQQIQDYLQNVATIKTAKVLLSPIWVRSMPKDSAKVQVNFEY